jgi:hypothetical protein
MPGVKLVAVAVAVAVVVGGGPTHVCGRSRKLRPPTA